MPLRTGVGGGVGTVEPLWDTLLDLLREVGLAVPEVTVCEMPWRLVELVEVTLAFPDIEASALKRDCDPALALPLMFLIAPRGLMQTSFPICRGCVSTDLNEWASKDRLLKRCCVGSVGLFVNWVRELEDRMTVKATSSWFLYTVKGWGFTLLPQTRHCEMSKNKECFSRVNKGVSTRSLCRVLSIKGSRGS